jgi:hypothetical protein
VPAKVNGIASWRAFSRGSGGEAARPHCRAGRGLVTVAVAFRGSLLQVVALLAEGDVASIRAFVLATGGWAPLVSAGLHDPACSDRAATLVGGDVRQRAGLWRWRKSRISPLVTRACVHLAGSSRLACQHRIPGTMDKRWAAVETATVHEADLGWSLQVPPRPGERWELVGFVEDRDHDRDLYPRPPGIKPAPGLFTRDVRISPSRRRHA